MARVGADQLDSLDLLALETASPSTDAVTILQVAAEAPLEGARQLAGWLDAGRSIADLAAALDMVAIRHSQFDEHVPTAVLDLAMRAPPPWNGRVLTAATFGRGRTTNPPWSRREEAEAILAR